MAKAVVTLAAIVCGAYTFQAEGHNDTFSGEWGIKRSVFQGHVFWNGIRLPGGYSQKTLMQLLKGILRCMAEGF